VHASCATCPILQAELARLRERRVFPFSGKSPSSRNRISWNQCDKKEYLLSRDISPRSPLKLSLWYASLCTMTGRSGVSRWSFLLMYAHTEILQMPVVLMMRQLSGVVCLRSLKLTKEQTSVALTERFSRNMWPFAIYDLQKLHKSPCDIGCTICCSPFFVLFPVTASFIVRIVSRRCNDAVGSWRADKFHHRRICIADVPIERYSIRCARLTRSGWQITKKITFRVRAMIIAQGMSIPKGSINSPVYSIGRSELDVASSKSFPNVPSVVRLACSCTFS